MSSADPESQSISSGRSFPMWLRTKTDNKFDFDNQAISPPAHDESFFYIRYPTDASTNDKKSSTTSNSIKSTISDAITKQQFDVKTNLTKGSFIEQKSMVQHTEPCKKFLNSKERELIIDNVKHPPKPFGTDDGFKGAGAACGSSIVKVAHQMVSAKSLGRGFAIANTLSKDSEEVLPEPNISNDPIANRDSPHNDQMSTSSRLMVRRGSKSLPASPLGSPKTMRRSNNPYFTGTFAIVNQQQQQQQNNATNAPDSYRGWFLSSLLGMQRENMSSTTSVASSHISEEGDDMHSQSKTSSSTSSSAGAPKVIKAKPSELREMNFWTPTSM
ncbi:uncharacterized protein LOC116347290 [Contarinia nasturtii]|uniref:uncharacterized protein LOC116347290 n=1 Tax=Contarinia nasturtii TaxID=265458 RepID=UPI0012D3B469|nr:uncharacterized protein LOC116347290 [Contarinia nasturtii]